MNKKILVTGGAGFIGSHLCERLLTEGYGVVSLDNFNDFYSPEIKRENIAAIERHALTERFKSYAGDIRNHRELSALLDREKPDGVIHLAAMAGVRPSIQNPELYVDVNIRGTQILLEACVRKGIRHFIFASSSSVYGNNAKLPFCETDTVDYPISPYAATKKAGELICRTYAHLYPVKIFCMRFFTVYGPRQRPDLAIHKFTKLILAGEEIPLFGDGLTRRDYTYIDDIIDGLAKALDRNMAVDGDSGFEIFNLGQSNTVSLSEMIACLEKALGMKARLKKMPLEAGDVSATYADITKAEKILRYYPATLFEGGITKFIDWIRREELIVSK